ncbi:hypothetical protein RND81_05G014500 [Saponaria officinalis]|uniref:Uncharacterized protein n=1 Tax=Saponaria officinalis TaxID=3572 RepID=A0AAW1KWK7_SAPOF
MLHMGLEMTKGHRRSILMSKGDSFITESSSARGFRNQKLMQCGIQRHYYVLRTEQLRAPSFLANRNTFDVNNSTLEAPSVLQSSSDALHTAIDVEAAVHQPLFMYAIDCILMKWTIFKFTFGSRLVAPFS